MIRLGSALSTYLFKVPLFGTGGFVFGVEGSCLGDLLLGLGASAFFCVWGFGDGGLGPFGWGIACFC